MTKSLVCSAFTSTRWWISAVRKLRSSHGFGGLVLRVFFLFCGGCEGSFKPPRLFLSVELPMNEIFFKIGISEEKPENRIWQSLLSPLSPHFMRAEAALGVDRRRGRRDTKHGTQLNLNLGSNDEDGAEWVQWQSLQSQISIPGLGLR